MPLSDKQLAANRANAKKSTGPVTESGKRRSSKNGTRHGIHASVLLIAGESRERFTELVNGLYAEYLPETPTEIAMVNKIAAAQWRQQRAWAMESACLTHEIQNQSAAQASDDPAVRAMLAVRSISGHSQSLGLMSRYEHRYDRQQYRAIEALNRLKDRKKSKLPHEPPQLQQNQSHSKTTDPIQTMPEPKK